MRLAIIVTLAFVSFDSVHVKFVNNNDTHHVNDLVSKNEVIYLFKTRNKTSQLNLDHHRRVRRSVPVDRNRLFLDRKVNYLIDPWFPEKETQTIQSAIQKLSEASCVEFVQLSEKPTDDNIDYVHILPSSNCIGEFGRVGGRQMFNLSLTCLEEPTVMHEMLHTLGMWHEHSRWDRDEYVTVLYDNIIPSKKNYFRKLTQTIDDTLSLPYDYSSIMHYKSFDYSIDPSNLRTIISKNPNISSDSIGKTDKLSDLDKQRLNKLYRCDVKRCLDPTKPLNGEVIGDNFEVGAKISYKCKDDTFTLIGSNSRFCKFDGQWSASTPICVQQFYHFCNFETDFCGWQNNVGWVRNELRNQTEHTGPVTDNTLGTPKGHFIYTRSRRKQKGDIASIETPSFSVPDNVQKSCVSFAYYLWGERIGTLKVYIHLTQSGNKKLIFEKSGNIGPKWLIAKYAISAAGQSLHFTFEVIIGGNLLSDIAIDDFVFMSCTQEEIELGHFEIIDLDS
ncbi:MAM and CCP domain-containing astacin-like metallopeptidase protein [Dinothrombium tinctorium]|uniref:Metalloendopeptidase n=1 Tax=Dinothrombium tinctorium TaxID=1965070 RepID=A0A443R763_9ACAR|nr:MAM and CCP domain-containing astacin-like metallopeptidase protein [Dinothrombium tinctorium]RWS13973.1 MAM and CCP domain-containing astacin-like metallopeptidase protein [Dinothrombium tinctorium]